MVAASVDSEENAQKTIEECGINFPVGYDLDVKEVSRLTGAFYEEKRQVLHSTGYLLRPDGKIMVGVYSSGPIGRLVWQDALAVVEFVKSQAT